MSEPEPQTAAQELAAVLQAHRAKNQALAPQPTPGLLAKLKNLWS